MLWRKIKEARGVRVGKFLILNRNVRAGLAETFIQGWGGGGPKLLQEFVR